jgi:hypothetical protein
MRKEHHDVHNIYGIRHNLLSRLHYTYACDLSQKWYHNHISREEKMYNGTSTIIQNFGQNHSFISLAIGLAIGILWWCRKIAKAHEMDERDQSED